MKRTAAGFTLVEIMIVVAIIGMLAAIAIPAFVKARNSARRTACINNLRQIDGAKDSFAIEYGGVQGLTLTWTNVSLYVKDMASRCYCQSAPLAQRYFSSNYVINVLGVNPECLVRPGTSVDPNHTLIY